MTRFARTRRVFYFEEPLGYEAGQTEPDLWMKTCERSGVIRVVPRLPEGLDERAREEAVRRLLDGMMMREGIRRPVLWYYTPMMLSCSRHLPAAAVVYDCMDELANFKGASADLMGLERELFAKADLVTTGGYSLYEAKREQHGNVHAFPSSVDREHLAQARTMADGDEPSDQAAIEHPRLGFYGVIDERMDLELIGKIADARPDWALVMVGPVVKIDPADLPIRPNIHYLGGKSYAELPRYLAGWDVALMPFAVNEATKFISPTKTPEYLSGGAPVVSTPITDVVRSYGHLDAVRIANNADEFVAACEAALAMRASGNDWLKAADKLLADNSWDNTFKAMSKLVEDAANRRTEASERRYGETVGNVVPVIGRAKAYDYLIVGAGFAGSVLAERLAADGGKKVLVIDRRPHIAGNAFDLKDEAGVLMHQYGPHIFHTNSEDIFNYLGRFTEWRPYEHRVLASVRDKLMPMPINRTTLNILFDLNLQTDEEADAFLNSRAEEVAKIVTSEDVVVSKVGRELYELFFQCYTRKQWGMDPSELDKSVTSRVPTRTNTDDRYFTDSFQYMPLNGYTAMFENMLDHDNIDVQTGVDFRDVQSEVKHDKLVFTGPIDEYFGHRYGKLPYRSLKFQHETLDQEWFQEVGTVNYPAESFPYTRISEYKHLTGQSHPKTTITYEYPSAEGDPYYPIPRPENQALFKRYEALALQTPEVTFVGRLATYRYYNMDQVVGQALATYRRLSEKAQGERTAATATQAAATA
ncbi:MAG: UDP-galactopyranose mutase [Proteobacteria bacterium]|nr:UDP-galactopyranose mutase [Pseudomonadota bacterium]